MGMKRRGKLKFSVLDMFFRPQCNRNSATPFLSVSFQMHIPSLNAFSHTFVFSLTRPTQMEEFNGERCDAFLSTPINAFCDLRPPGLISDWLRSTGALCAFIYLLTVCISCWVQALCTPPSSFSCTERIKLRVQILIIA